MVLTPRLAYALPAAMKEPIEPEYKRIQDGQIIYTYFHLAAVPELAKVLVEKRVAAVAYETIQPEDGSLPLPKGPGLGVKINPDLFKPDAVGYRISRA